MLSISPRKNIIATNFPFVYDLKTSFGNAQVLIALFAWIRDGVLPKSTLVSHLLNLMNEQQVPVPPVMKECILYFTACVFNHRKKPALVHHLLLRQALKQSSAHFVGTLVCKQQMYLVSNTLVQYRAEKDILHMEHQYNKYTQCKHLYEQVCDAQMQYQLSLFHPKRMSRTAYQVFYANDAKHMPIHIAYCRELMGYGYSVQHMLHHKNEHLLFKTSQFLVTPSLKYMINLEPASIAKFCKMNGFGVRYFATWIAPELQQAYFWNQKHNQMLNFYDNVQNIIHWQPIKKSSTHLHTLNDLTSEHLPMLVELKSASITFMKETFNMDEQDVAIAVHFPSAPDSSSVHFHVGHRVSLAEDYMFVTCISLDYVVEQISKYGSIWGKNDELQYFKEYHTTCFAASTKVPYADVQIKCCY